MDIPLSTWCVVTDQAAVAFPLINPARAKFDRMESVRGHYGRTAYESRECGC